MLEDSRDLHMTSLGGDVYFYAQGVASVRWDPAGSTVLVEWEGWASSAEFMALLDAEVRALTEHSCTQLLADCRRQKVLSPADQEWGDREWLPRAVAAGLKRFAIVLPISVLATMNLQERLRKVPETVLRVGYFNTLEEARAWLAEG
jgi:hypothetical protein